MNEKNGENIKDNENMPADTDERNDEYKDWLTFSQTDFECAKYLNGAPFYPRPLNVICYHCQQAAEKAVKALIVYFGCRGGVPKVHDISFLLCQLKNIVYDQKGIEIDDELLMMANSLSKYGVAPRYPNELEVEEYHVKKALKDCEYILKWVNDVIKK